jgi:hypothetical protein
MQGAERPEGDREEGGKAEVSEVRDAGGGGVPGEAFVVLRDSIAVDVGAVAFGSEDIMRDSWERCIPVWSRKNERGDLQEIYGPVWYGGRGDVERAVRMAYHVNGLWSKEVLKDSSIHAARTLIGAREALCVVRVRGLWWDGGVRVVVVEELLRQIIYGKGSSRAVIGDKEADVPLRPEYALCVEIVRTTRMADVTLLFWVLIANPSPNLV